MKTTRPGKNKFVGTCQACFGDHVVTPEGEIVLHGYKRPGDGAVRGDCIGTKREPYELSCELTKRMLQTMMQTQESSTTRLKQLEEDQVDFLWITIVVGPRQERPLKIGRDYSVSSYNNFEWHRRRAVAQLKSELDVLGRQVEFFSKKVADWKHAPEALRDHETLVREEKAVAAAKREARLWATNWKRLWAYIGSSIRNYKDESAWIAQVVAGGASQEVKQKRVEEFTKKYGHLEPWPTDKERANARKR